MSLRKFDVFPKLDNEFRVGTTTGGCLTIMSIISVIVLSITEISTYLHPDIRQRLAVDMRKPTGPDGITIDQNAQPKLDITLNITFPSAPCYLLHFDVIEPLSQLALPIDQISHQFKRLSPAGTVLGDFSPEDLLKSKPVKCGSCGRANTTEKICCNTCQELFDLYEDQMLKPPRLYEAEQCKEIYQTTKSMDGEGCSIYAKFSSVLVASEFHIAPGYSRNKNGNHIHDIKLFNKTFADVNLTHIIHEIRYSNKEHSSPLDGTIKVQREKKPFRALYTSDIQQNTFSTNSYELYNPKRFSPGVFFRYDVSPINAEEYIDREPFSHLLTRLLTVFGATLGLFRFIDSISFKARKVQNKEELETK